MTTNRRFTVSSREQAREIAAAYTVGAKEDPQVEQDRADWAEATYDPDFEPVNPTQQCPDCGRRQGYDGHIYAPCGPTLDALVAEETAEFKRAALTNPLIGA